MDDTSMLFLYKSSFLCYNPPKGADTMKKPSHADKKAQKILNDPQFQKNWASHS